MYFKYGSVHPVLRKVKLQLCLNLFQLKHTDHQNSELFSLMNTRLITSIYKNIQII